MAQHSTVCEGVCTLGWEDGGKTTTDKIWHMGRGTESAFRSQQYGVHLAYLFTLTPSCSSPVSLTSVNDATLRQEPSQKPGNYLVCSLSPLGFPGFPPVQSPTFTPGGSCKCQRDHPNSLLLREACMYWPCPSPDPLLLPDWARSLVLFLPQGFALDALPALRPFPFNAWKTSTQSRAEKQSLETEPINAIYNPLRL